MYVRRPIDFSTLVRDRRQAKGWTQSDLAKRIGIQRSTIIDMEAGARQPRLDTALAVLNALGVSLWADVGNGSAHDPQNDASANQPNDNIPALVDDMLDDL